MERPEEAVPTRLRRSRAWALAAFLLLVTSFWLPWWTLAYQDEAGFTYDAVRVRPFIPEQPATTPWGPVASGVLAAGAAAWLFVRIAGRSHAYEPRTWRRDVCIQAVMVAVAWASALLWPDAVPSFWGGRTFSAEGSAFTETAAPGLGWWLVLLSAILLGVSWFTARDTSKSVPKAA